MPDSSLKIQIQHLGAVKNANIKLKPLTVFVGENSTGKTYSAYLISYIFSKYAYSRYQDLLKSKKFSTKFKEIESVLKDLEEKGAAEFDLKKFISNNSKKYFDAICNEVVAKNFKYFLAADTDLFDDVRIKMDIKNLDQIQYSHLSPHFISFSVENCEGCKKIRDCTTPTLISIDKKNLIIKFERNQNCIKKIDARPRIYRFILLLLHSSIFNDVYFLGAERTGMALFYHTMTKDIPQDSEVDEIEIDKNKDRPNSGELKVKFSKPVAELFNNIYAVFDPTSSEIRKRKIASKKEISKFIDFADILENQIIGGNISINKENNDRVSKLIFNYHSKNKIPLNMTMTSSGVKGLSPLILYLKYFIEPNELIVIDEPEINLHPKAQVKLIELLAMLANSKVNIIITTHSPYIVDHLINLMKANSSKKSKKTLANLFYLKNKEAFISKDNVSVYLFENGTAVDILQDENHINWQTFSKISDEITDIFFKIEDLHAF
jgi:predicted ATPase